jgi:putative oxidoreductase
VVIRLVLGVIFVAHGGQKIFGWWGGPGFRATIATFAKGGMPAPLTVLVMIGEFFGGLGVLVGCLTRLAAFGPAIVMAGAILFVHAQIGFFMNWNCLDAPGRAHGIECTLAYFAMAVSLMLTGGGPLSIDALFGGRRTDLDRL